MTPDALFDHRGRHGLRAVEHPAQVDVDHAVELFEGHLLQAGVLRDAGVVDQHVDAPEPLQHAAGRGVHHVAVRDVHHVAFGLRARFAALAHRFVDQGLAQVPDGDARAFTREFERCGQADALGGAGDDADLVLES